MKQETIDGNVLIAHFVGLIKGKWTGYWIGAFPTAVEEPVEDQDLLFHKDWNWLMMAVEKIESLKLEDRMSVTIVGRACLIVSEYGNLIEAEVRTYTWKDSTKINSTWDAVVKFIKWFNEQGKNEIQKS